MSAFFVASGLLAWWQFRPVTEPSPTAPGPARLPDYVVSRFTAVETDATGRPSRRLVADQLRQYLDEDLSELDQPRLTLFQPEEEPWRARANQGLVLAGGEEIHLMGQVEIERDGGANHRPARVESELIRIWHRRGFADTDRPVRATSAPDWLTATGMRLWYEHPVRAEFDGRAQIFLAPEQDDRP